MNPWSNSRDHEPKITAIKRTTSAKTTFALVANEWSCLAFDGFDEFFPEERLQCLRNFHAAVWLLVVFQDRDDPSCRCKGAVERGCDLRFAVLVAVPHAETPGLERRA